MALSYQDVYARIKALENSTSAQLPLPAPTDSIVVASIDAQSGAFTFKVPTFQQTITVPPGPDGKPHPPIVQTVGIVATNCVNLTLAFEVTNAPLTNAPPSALARVTGGAGRGGIVVGGSTGGVTLSGFPTSGTQGSRIFLNAGTNASAMFNSPTHINPGVSTFPIGVTAQAQDLGFQHIAILRPPVLGAGAFTIPALPVAVIFAPPQGQALKNSNTFNDKVTVSTTTTVSISNQTDTKTVQAYTAADLAGKVAGLLTQIAGLIAGAGAITTTGGSSAGTVVGGAGGGGASFGDVLKGFSAGYGALGSLLSGFGNQGTNSDTSSITTQTNNTLTLSLIYSDTYGSEQGKGPGGGDRFLFLQNVLAVWSNINGQVGLTVLGYAGVGAFSGDTLSADLKALAGGGTATSGLDADTIHLLLDLDPYFVVSKRPPNMVNPGPPLLGPPRFTPLQPLNRKGTGTTTSGDVFSLAVEHITDTSTTNTTKTIKVTDTKPGWIDVLMGADNVEKTSTVTATNTVTNDQKTDETVTNSITMVSVGPQDPYNIDLYFDNFSQTIVPVPFGSPVLQGNAGILEQPTGGGTPTTGAPIRARPVPGGGAPRVG
jgi:hypothetical protein